MRSKILLLGMLFLSTAFLYSCKEEEGCTDPDAINYNDEAEKDDGSCEFEETLDVPSTYSFSNVDFSGQTDRLNQLEEMTAYMKTGNTPGVTVSSAILQQMFENEGGNGGGNFSFSSEKQLKDKCFAPDVALFENYFIDLEIASGDTTRGSNGQSGVVTSNDGNSSYLFDSRGIEHIQLIEKGLMGAIFYYQATSVYMGDDKMDVDNSEVEEGKGTAMQHHWDEAYGYLGVTTDFPDDRDNVRFWGKYAVGRDALIGVAEDLSYALRKGRAAIDAKDYDARDEAIKTARAKWELVSAATAIHYINDALNNMTDDAIRNHALSEAHAFIGNLLYNEDKLISQAQIDDIRSNMIGYNLYEVTTSGLQSARDELAQIYDLEDVKTDL